jgi:hypothetical protein
LFLGFQFDGGWVDIGTISVASLWAAAKACKRRILAHRVADYISWFRTIICPGTTKDFGAGASIFPLVLLFASPFSSQVLAGLLEASKVTLCVAGAVALFSVLSDF